MNKTPLEVHDRVLLVGGRRFKWAPNNRMHVLLECEDVRVAGVSYNLCVQVMRDNRKEWGRVHGTAETRPSVIVTSSNTPCKVTDLPPKPRAELKAIIDEVVSSWRIYTSMNDVYRDMLGHRIRFLRDKEKITADGFRLMAEHADRRADHLEAMLDADDAEEQLDKWYDEAQGGLFRSFA